MPSGDALPIRTVEPSPLIDAAAFARDGFLVCRWPLFTPRAVDRLRAIAEEAVGEAACGRRSADLNQPHFTDRRLFDFLLESDVLDLMEALLGPDILLWSSQFFCKEPRTGAAVPWHADGYYWKWFIEPVRVVSIFLALDDQTMANGCLRVVPGSHRQPEAFAYRRAAGGVNRFFPKGVPEAMLHAETIVDLPLRRGEFVLFDAWLLHGSEANRSSQPRFSFTLRYAPTSCRVDAVGVRSLRRWRRSASGVVRRMLGQRDIYRHQIYLARGQDRAANVYHRVPA